MGRGLFGGDRPRATRARASQTQAKLSPISVLNHVLMFL